MLLNVSIARMNGAKARLSYSCELRPIFCVKLAGKTLDNIRGVGGWSGANYF